MLGGTNGDGERVALAGATRIADSNVITISRLGNAFKENGWMADENGNLYVEKSNPA